MVDGPRGMPEQTPKPESMECRPEGEELVCDLETSKGNVKIEYDKEFVDNVFGDQW